jgi:hypothetical protein
VPIYTVITYHLIQEVFGTGFVYFTLQPLTMTIQQFNILMEDMQHKYLLMKGECIGSRETAENCILLFQLEGFYVEVFFDKYCDDIIYSRTFENTEELQPYLEHLNIPIAN